MEVLFAQRFVLRQSENPDLHPGQLSAEINRQANRADRRCRFGLCVEQSCTCRRIARLDLQGVYEPAAADRCPHGSRIRIQKARSPNQEVGDAGLHRLSRGRKTVQIPEAPLVDPPWPHPGRTSCEMGPAGRLSAGRAKLRRSAFRTGKIDGIRTQAKARRRTASGSCQTEETRPQILIGPLSTVPQVAPEQLAAPFARFNRCRPECTGASPSRTVSRVNGSSKNRPPMTRTTTAPMTNVRF